MTIHSIWEEFPEIQNNLEECLILIKQKTTIANKQIEEAIYDLLDSGGKLLRPAYCLFFSKLGHSALQNHTQLISVAAATEVLHLATLVHDDIIDDSPMRRGSQTIQSKYGKDVAVYVGDFLLTVHFDLLADAGDSMQIIKESTDSMRQVLLGELEQMSNRYNVEITFEQYLKNIKGKTAQLFELSCSQGAFFGKAETDVVEKSAQIGHYIGISFQVLDDILDYSQTQEKFAKPVLEDVKQGVYSLPLILAMENHKEDFLPFLNKKQKMTTSDVDNIVALITKYEGIEKAHLVAQSYTEKALDLILELPDTPAREALYQLTKKLLDRSF